MAALGGRAPTQGRPYRIGEYQLRRSFIIAGMVLAFPITAVCATVESVYQGTIMPMDLTRREIMLMGAAATLVGGGAVAAPGMELAMASTQSEIRALLDSRSEAIRIKDIDRLLSFYSLDVVYFDIVPGLQYLGSAALRGRFLHWFDSYKGPIGQEIRDLKVLASGDVAVASMLIRAGGTLKNGREVGFWVRATTCCQRSDQGWSIAHEHVSLPVDLESGSAARDLEP